MGKYDKLLLQVLRGLSDSNIGFDELCGLLKQLDFEMRVRAVIIRYKLGAES